jgi:cystathionine gamma-lyase
MVAPALDVRAIREQQRTIWDDVSAGWSRWRPQFERGGAAVTARLLELGGVASGMSVLDVGSGVGEPALTAARAVGPTGRVVGVDISPSMVEAARAAAGAAGEVDNVEFVVGAVERTPLRARSFDVALSRFGLMFAADRRELLGKVARVLRPRGVLAAAVWCEPERVPMISLAFRVISRELELDPPLPGPGPFAMADAAAVAAELEEAGFGNVEVEELVVPFEFDGVDDFARFSRDVLPPRMKQLLEERCGSVDDRELWDVFAAAARAYEMPDETVMLPSACLCIRAVAGNGVAFDTRLVQAGQRELAETGDVVAPIHVAATYERSAQERPAYFYARSENPTREGLEECLASLEDARFASVYASGQAASTAVLSLLEPGQRVLAGDDLYGGTHRLLSLVGRSGIDVEYADLSKAEVVAHVLDPKRADCSVVWVETPSNPLLKIVDLELVCGLAHAAGAIVVVDNTLASPALQQPLRWADISLYSTTKSISGHLDALGGAVVYDDPSLHDRLVTYRDVAGNVPGALDCYLIRRGLKTLALRTARQVETAAAVAEVLRAHPDAGAVHFPGLADHAGHEVACRQMSAPGSVISFEYLGDVDTLLERVCVFAAAVSLGGVQSLIEAPASMTHRGIAGGIPDNLVRLSIGIEDPADLVKDLETAMRAAR